MNQASIRIFFGGVAVFAALVVGGVSSAPASRSMDWNVLGSGGGVSSSAHYVVHGTLGQPASGPPPVLGTDLALNAGYWFEETITKVFLPFLRR